MLAEKDHLLFIAPTAYPLGGVAVWLDYVLTGLVNNTQAQVTLGAVSGDYHRPDEYLEHYPFDNVEVIPCGSGSAYSRTNSIASTIKRLKPTVVVCVNIPDVYLATRLLRHKNQGGFQLVSTIHGVLPRLFSDLNEYDDVIDHVVVTNHLTRLMVMATTSYIESQVHYAPYGVEIPTSDKLSSGHHHAESAVKLKILYCGRIDVDQKRCQDLLSITQRLIEDRVAFELLIAGDGSYKPELLTQLNDAVAKVNTNASDSNMALIRDLGVLRADQVSRLAYQKANVLLLTSDWETGPIVVWEAMAHGLCVVTSRYIGLGAEGALENQTNSLIFDIGDTDSAAELLKTTADQRTAEALVLGGYCLVQDRYTREKSVTAWVEVFLKVSRSLPGSNDYCADDDPSHHQQVKLKPVIIAPQGRLEHWLGLSIANHFRSFLGLKVTMNSAGDEWPHAHSCVSDGDEDEFRALLKTIEARHQ